MPLFKCNIISSYLFFILWFGQIAERMSKISVSKPRSEMNTESCSHKVDERRLLIVGIMVNQLLLLIMLPGNGNGFYSPYPHKCFPFYVIHDRQTSTKNIDPAQAIWLLPLRKRRARSQYWLGMELNQTSSWYMYTHVHTCIHMITPNGVRDYQFTWKGSWYTLEHSLRSITPVGSWVVN